MRHREHLHLIPDHMREAICRWIEDPLPPKLMGSFLYAVLTNDLAGAVGHADMANKRALPEWILYLYNYAPAPCWGSAEKVNAWHAAHEEARNAERG